MNTVHKVELNNRVTLHILEIFLKLRSKSYTVESIFNCTSQKTSDSDEKPMSEFPTLTLNTPLTLYFREASIYRL